MKICSACKCEKQYNEFGVRAASPDGLTAACRECLKARDKARYPKEREKRRVGHSAYAAGKGKDAVRRANKRWLDKNEVKRAAHVIANNAMRDGKLIKKPCEICGSHDVHGHHDDYSRPLDVRWLCAIHHKKHHKEMAIAGIDPLEEAQ